MKLLKAFYNKIEVNKHLKNGKKTSANAQGVAFKIHNTKIVF